MSVAERKDKIDIMILFQNNRAPYVLPMHTNWFLQDAQKDGIKLFVEWTLEQHSDIHYTTMTDFLLWMTEDPRPAKPRSATHYSFLYLRIVLLVR